MSFQLTFFLSSDILRQWNFSPDKEDCCAKTLFLDYGILFHSQTPDIFLSLKKKKVLSEKKESIPTTWLLGKNPSPEEFTRTHLWTGLYRCSHLQRAAVSSARLVKHIMETLQMKSLGRPGQRGRRKEPKAVPPRARINPKHVNYGSQLWAPGSPCKDQIKG